MNALAILLALALLAPQQTRTPEQQQADAHYQSQSWQAAADAYLAIVKAGGATGPDHLRLAVSLMSLGRHAEAKPQLEKAEALGVPMPQVALRLASILAGEGDIDGAFAQMQRATDVGLTAIPPQLASDPGFKRLESDPRYEDLLAAIDRNARPCEHDPKYREFDFWIGDWDVRAAAAPPNSPPASNVITKIHGGCVILESWTAPGQTGQSFNIYDRSHGKWHQTWVDSTGGLHEYWGTFENGNLVYFGDLPPLRGQTARRHTRLTFFNLGPNKVRQLSESSSDGGKTWSVTYDLIYTRKGT